MSDLKYKCQFCDKPTNHKDWHGETCARCYGLAFPPAAQHTHTAPLLPQPANPWPYAPNRFPTIVTYGGKVAG